MSTAAYLIITDGASTVTVHSFKNITIANAMAERAAKEGNTFYVATDKDLSKVPTPVLVKVFNTIRPEKPITKFADRATAEKRLNGVLEVLAKPGMVPSDLQVAKGGFKKGEGGERPGRVSSFAGKVIRKLVDENPRREGTFGYNSWSVLRSGMTYEAYITAGGRRQDLAWDLAHKFVKLEDKE